MQPTLRPVTWTPAIRMGLSIAVATGLYGVSFGALAVAAGLTVGQAMALSILIYISRPRTPGRHLATAWPDR